MSNIRRQAESIIESYDHEAQDTIRHTRIDLDAFLALKGEARAARWRGFDRSAKEDAIIQQLRRKGIEWTAELLESWIAKYDAKWGAEPLPTEAATMAALSRLAHENAAHARTARAAGERDDAAFFQRAATAYTNALIEYRSGVRPTQAGDSWLLPSRRAGEPAHLVRKDGDWVCCCKAGASMHWPIALIIGLEVAADAMDREDDASTIEIAPRPTPRPFGQRLADARACYLVAA